MIHNSGFVRRVIAGLALIATLGIAVLPDGQVPKVAGPCGRALCNCREELSTTRRLCPTCQRTHKALRVLTLGPSVFSDLDDAGLAFHVAVDAGIPPMPARIVFASGEASDAAPESRAFNLKLANSDIPTPPPRA